jgi:hypothetical protein
MQPPFWLKAAPRPIPVLPNSCMGGLHLSISYFYYDKRLCRLENPSLLSSRPSIPRGGDRGLVVYAVHSTPPSPSMLRAGGWVVYLYTVRPHRTCHKRGGDLHAPDPLSYRCWGASQGVLKGT